MEINYKKQDYLNSAIIQFVELLEHSIEKPLSQSNFGSINLKEVVDLSKYLVDTPRIISETNGVKVLSKKECINFDCIGLNSENYSKFIKFLENIYKDKNFNEKISFSFLEKISFQYILDNKNEKNLNQLFSSYLIQNIIKEVKEYEIYFKVLYLDIDACFNIGNVNFSYVDESFFNNTNKDILFKTYKGEVLVSYKVKAEREKAKEKALKKCSLAIDCLKLCFDTIAIPNIKTSFDIDSRTNENLQNEILLKDIHNPNDISIDKFRVPSHQNINNNSWNIITNRGLEVFNSFLLSIDEKDELSELELLISNSLQLFAYSISINNLNRRVVELFTLLESLLLPDSNAPILDCLAKYLSKLITKNIDERKNIISLIKEMYAVRSSYVHHASNKSIDLEKLGKFQILIHMLILKFIKLSEIHSTKKTILDEIDDAILGAY
ncbi:hypothetical protein HNP24_001038 [Chryseobacterium sediminis]|uniref:Apea-like HEPN domain-containing protein n=1 Tax=Chryseobacterium sediminis TaxID=1679494 RepID=A0ABR6PWP2_9FLAO|nr:HEPN domain-containing protein [Chryseobacterium sediminis]MBB6330088.1 hypothetical protein [Chryseobacterium sediminis]